MNVAPMSAIASPVHDVLNSSGQPLDENTRAFMEPHFGHDFSKVRIHTDERAVESTQAVNALAYTVGNNVVFARGQYAPGTGEGNRLLAHELTHVVQQHAGDRGSQLEIGPTDDRYEQEAKAVSSTVNATFDTDSRTVGPGAYDASPSSSRSSAPVNHTSAVPTIQRQASPQAPQMSVTPEYAQGLTDEQINEQVHAVRAQSTSSGDDSSLQSAVQENLNILETEVTRRTQQVQQDLTTARDQLIAQRPYIDPNTPVFVMYANASERLSTLGTSIPDEIQGVPIPGDQLITVSDAGKVQMLPDAGIAEVGEDLFPILNAFAAASQGGELPPTGGDELQQIVLWEDGRAVITPPNSSDLATLLIHGQPAEVESRFMLTNVDVPWERVRNSSMQGLLTSGIYQFGSFPISRFNGINLPANYRIRFADPGHAVDSRLITIFEEGTKRYYGWDAHAPMPGAAPHDFYHVNQKGMFNIFGQSDHAPIPPSRLGAARGLRYVRVGGRIFLIVGVFVDAYQFGQSIGESVDQGTPRPAIAQAVRTIGGWGGAWAGAKLLCVGGGAVTIETGPGAVLGCIAGGIVGGFAGYFAADWIADMISPN